MLVGLFLVLIRHLFAVVLLQDGAGFAAFENAVKLLGILQEHYRKQVSDKNKKGHQHESRHRHAKSVPEVPTDAFCREHREEDPSKPKTWTLQQGKRENEKSKNDSVGIK